LNRPSPLPVTFPFTPSIPKNIPVFFPFSTQFPPTTNLANPTHHKFPTLSQPIDFHSIFRNVEALTTFKNRWLTLFFASQTSLGALSVLSPQGKAIMSFPATMPRPVISTPARPRQRIHPPALKSLLERPKLFLFQLTLSLERSPEKFCPRKKVIHHQAAIM
jgi:hypothetical protein